MVANEATLAIKYYRGKPAKFRLVTEVPTSLDDKIKKGIDAIYENELFDGKPPPPKYVISEVKANTNNLPDFDPVKKLSMTKYGGKQMSKKWIDKNLEQFEEELLRDIRKNGYDPLISDVNMEGVIGSMNMIDDSAKRIMKL